MKVKCEHCGKDMSKTVFNSITKNEIGRVQCPHCKKENKRYLSELDLMYAFLLNSIVYGFAVLLLMFVTTLQSPFVTDNFFLVYFVTIAIVLAICYLFTRQNSLYQYLNPIFHKSWATQKQNEDIEEASRRLNFNIVMFIVIAIVIGTNPDWLYLYLFMFEAFIIITAIKVYLLYKSEMETYQTKKGS